MLDSLSVLHSQQPGNIAENFHRVQAKQIFFAIMLPPIFNISLAARNNYFTAHFEEFNENDPSKFPNWVSMATLVNAETIYHS